MPSVMDKISHVLRLYRRQWRFLCVFTVYTVNTALITKNVLLLACFENTTSLFCTLNKFISYWLLLVQSLIELLGKTKRDFLRTSCSFGIIWSEVVFVTGLLFEFHVEKRNVKRRRKEASPFKAPLLAAKVQQCHKSSLAHHNPSPFDQVKSPTYEYYWIAGLDSSTATFSQRLTFSTRFPTFSLLEK